MVVGISPFNSYFSLNNIATLSNWAAHHFESFSLFIPDEPSIYTLMALGYSEAKATQKSKRQANYLRNKCSRALGSLHFSPQEAAELILDFGKLKQNEHYSLALKFYKEKYNNDIEFRKNCLETSRVVVGNQTEQISSDCLEIAVKYLLAEMPLFFNSANILKKKEAIFCYRNCVSLIRTIFKENENNTLNNQGYLILDLEAN